MTSRERLLEEISEFVNSRGTSAQPRAYDMARLIVDLLSERDTLSALAKHTEADNSRFVEREKWWTEKMFALEAERDALQYEALGFAYAWACSLLDRGLDPREVEVPELTERWLNRDAAMRGKEQSND